MFTALLFTALLFTALLFTALLFTALLFTALLFTALLFTALLFTALFKIRSYILVNDSYYDLLNVKQTLEMTSSNPQTGLTFDAYVIQIYLKVLVWQILGNFAPDSFFKVVFYVCHCVTVILTYYHKLRSHDITSR